MTHEEWKIIRKALQCVRMAHMVTETADGINDRDTKLDALIRKIRAFEDGLTEEPSNGTIEEPDCE